MVFVDLSCCPQRQGPIRARPRDRIVNQAGRRERPQSVSLLGYVIGNSECAGQTAADQRSAHIGRKVASLIWRTGRSERVSCIERFVLKPQLGISIEPSGAASGSNFGAASTLKALLGRKCIVVDPNLQDFVAVRHSAAGETVNHNVIIVGAAPARSGASEIAKVLSKFVFIQRQIGIRPGIGRTTQSDALYGIQEFCSAQEELFGERAIECLGIGLALVEQTFTFAFELIAKVSNLSLLIEGHGRRAGLLQQSLQTFDALFQEDSPGFNPICRRRLRLHEKSSK